MIYADPMERPTLDTMRALVELVEQGYGVTLAGAGGARGASGSGQEQCDERAREYGCGKRNPNPNPGGGNLAMLRTSVAAALRPMPPQLQGLTASFLQKMTVGDFILMRETQEYGEGVKEHSTEQRPVAVMRSSSVPSAPILSPPKSPQHPAAAAAAAAAAASPSAAEEAPGESPRRTTSRKLKELLMGMLPGGSKTAR